MYDHCVVDRLGNESSDARREIRPGRHVYYYVSTWLYICCYNIILLFSAKFSLFCLAHLLSFSPLPTHYIRIQYTQSCMVYHEL